MESGILNAFMKNLSRPGILNFYYLLKPVLPRALQLTMRRQFARMKMRTCSDRWPIDRNCAKAPDGWTGWPGGNRFAFIITHDVDSAGGYAKCRELATLELEMGFRSSFNFVPEGYSVENGVREYLKENGFEVGLHGIRHDGKLYKSKETFARNAAIINSYLKEWDCVGFRSPSMHCVLDWIHQLEIEYDASTFDTDPFEPYPSGVLNIFPFLVKAANNGRAFVELPYTLPQDFTLFVLMRHRTNAVWKKKLDWIAEQGGMALINTHPDYMNFDGKKCGKEEYPAELYRDFLEYLRTSHKSSYWHVLPRDMARYWAGRA